MIPLLLLKRTVGVRRRFNWKLMFLSIDVNRKKIDFSCDFYLHSEDTGVEKIEVYN
jgi:hypothetical protein